MKVKPKKELKKANKSSNNQESLTAAAALEFMTQERQEMDHEAAILRSENAKLKKRLEDEMKKAEESNIIINDNDGVGDGSRDDIGLALCNRRRRAAQQALCNRRLRGCQAPVCNRQRPAICRPNSIRNASTKPMLFQRVQRTASWCKDPQTQIH